MAAVVDRGRILTMTCNQAYSRAHHAESLVIDKFLRQHHIVTYPWQRQRRPFTSRSFYNIVYNNEITRALRRITIVVIRVNERSEILNSMPCKNCSEYLKHLKVRRIIYSSGESICGTPQIVIKRPLELDASYTNWLERPQNLLVYKKHRQ